MPRNLQTHREADAFAEAHMFHIHIFLSLGLPSRYHYGSGMYHIMVPCHATLLWNAKRIPYIDCSALFD